MIKPDDFVTKVTSMPMELAVNLGRTVGYSPLDKFGVNPLVETTTDPEDIWEAGGVYPHDADGTAPIVSLISSSASDTVDIEITGLDIDGNQVMQTVTLTGTTRVALDTALWRVFRMANVGTSSLVGTVYCYVGTGGIPSLADTRAIIDDGNNQTLMAIYTIPHGKVGFLFRGEIGVELEGGPAALADYAHCHYESRRYGKIFRVKKAVTCIVGGGSSTYQDYRSFPDIIPALTDIRIRAVEVSAAMGLFATFDILLVDEDKFTLEYLQAIGQPGY